MNHVERIVETCFDRSGTELLVGRHPVSRLAEQFGTPLFVYDAQVMLEKSRQLHAILPPNFELYYSIKANPNAAILRLFVEQSCGLEVASAGELFQALAAGCEPENIVFAGPGKTADELSAAIDAGIREIHIESIEEARCIEKLTVEMGRQPTRIAVRINPTDAAGGAMRMGGKPSPFGIDEEDLQDTLSEILTFDHVCVDGVHLFMGTQILDAETLVFQYDRAIEIAQRVATLISRPLRSIDFGGGLGTPCFPHESELNLADVEAGLRDIKKRLHAHPLTRDARGMIEPGRFLVSEAGVYLARVTRVKRSRGKTFAVIDGGMHHHLAASGNLGQTIKRNYPVAVANKLDQAPVDSVEIVGPLCTPLDCLARSACLPDVEAGDLIAVFQSGAYARTSSPHGFLSHNTPPEVLIHGDKADLIRERGTPADYLRDQPKQQGGD